MDKPLFLCYPKCGTCRKAAAWLGAHGIEVESRDIVECRPTREELVEWIAASGLPVRKWFNTSGLKYKELNLKKRVGSASESELIDLLASDGKLVKRPVLVSERGVLVGFREESWHGLLG